MALIGKIRNNSWLLVVMIGLGLGGFIFMDMFSGQQSVFGSGATEMANIDGRSVDIAEFNRVEGILYANSSGDPFSRRQFLFNSFVDETLVNKEAEAMGLGVSDVELEELTFGNNPSPIILSRFADPQTRQINRQALESYRDGTRPEQANPFWNHQKGEIKTERLKSKITTMVEKAIYTPSWLAEMSAADKSNFRKVAIVKVPYSAMENTDVTLSDADYSTYLSKNMVKYESTEEQRKVEYVVFPVVATEKDKADMKAEMVDLAVKFRTAENDTNFVSQNYGTMTAQWFDNKTLPAIAKDTLSTMSQGAVYGPYLEGNAYKLAKITQRVTMQDSAKCRHILLTATTPAEFVTASTLADSLMSAMRSSNPDWDDLAARYSTDPGSKDKGGFYDYATVNTYVPEFNDVVFLSSVGSLEAVRTQFGIHIIEPLGRKGNSNTYYRMAYVSQNIIPSDETQRDVENQAIEFVDANRTSAAMATAAAAKGLTVETSQSIKANDYVLGAMGGSQTSRDIIRWSFANSLSADPAEVGDVSPEIYAYNNAQDFYTDKYVAVALKSIQEPGQPSVADVKEEIEPFVINAKKAETLIGQLSGKTDLNSVASSYEDVTVDTISGVTFGSASVTNMGIEPALQGAIFNTAVNTVSTPVEGNGGVFVFKILEETPSQNPQTLAQNKQAASNAVRQQVKAKLIQALRKNVEISDNRARYF
ncbi:MAG: peptidyl-prolyl cis-trans isomerase D [Saprospiraceae bacterium]|jgi:peptidyl-prolyl cis-trans isomerase D